MNTQDLLNISAALTNAVVSGRFMSAEHAKAIWLKILKDSGIDTPRQPKVGEVEKPVEKPVESKK